MNTSTTNVETVVDTITAEGYDRAEVVAVIDSLVEAGAEGERDEDTDELYLTAGDVQVVREQLGRAPR